ncbi:PAAR domain-containing protein [Endozoicomonas sp. SM1973]|uniref:PAAR domain-containing protein n=1 Tax=Spartinivicinus marinus TaxID=2994442 RepID=A0A853IPD7_9GAMM|nr:PAAR domain-containing protein [Spartinivicinus marinus]
MAKVGDKHSYPLWGGNTVVEGSSSTLVDELPVARVGDKTAFFNSYFELFDFVVTVQSLRSPQALTL